MTPAQCREARALLGWSRADLAKASMVVPESIIAKFENDVWIGLGDRAAIQGALGR